MSRLRVAIVGAGVGRAHLAGYLAHPELFAVTVICDLDAARAGELAAEAPGAVVETRLAATLRRADVDVIDICLPPVLHHDAILDALAADKEVICEKPLVGSLAQLDAVEAAARAAGRGVLPVYQYRFGNGFGRLLHLIGAGHAGVPLVATLETHWNRDASYYAVPWRGRFATELGGAVVSHAIHAHDLLTTALGPVARVAARTAVRVNPIETEDCAAVVLEMASGALVTSSITLGAARDTSRLRFCFTELTAESSLAPYQPGSEPWTFTARHPATQATLDQTLAGWSPTEEGFPRLFALYHEALTGGGPLPATLTEARTSLALASAIYHSARTGLEVTLPLGADHPLHRGWLPT